MRALLYVVRGKAVFVIYHCVMRGLNGALKSGMCLEVKVEIEAFMKKQLGQIKVIGEWHDVHPSNTFVNNSAWTCISIPVCVLGVGGVEPRAE